MFQEDLDLIDLVNLEEWQKAQDQFSEVLEITIKTLSADGILISTISRPSRFCSDATIKKTDLANECVNCPSQTELAALSQLSPSKNVINFKCPFGLDAFVIPIRAVGNRTVAYLSVGPLILTARRTRAEYQKEARKRGINIERLMDALIEISVFSHNKVYSIIDILGNIFTYMAQAGYHKKRLGEIAPEVVEMDPLFSRYYEEKILGALLRSCTLALDADSGSVMTLDKKTNMLHIKAASKLDEDIVNNTNVKVGEGIAGLAAATSKPIVLPKDKNKGGLARKMKRRDIKSSLIVPFNKGKSHDVYGVINLNLIRKARDFSDKDIALVKELVKMASISLIPLHSPAAH